tara:strand:- start:133 stop:795 length:663 start_codon:yes stop_codon:yes gene_type:complete
MKSVLFFLIAVLNISLITGQEIDSDLLDIRERMDSIEKFNANLKLEVDINFINMPVKDAQMKYTKGEDVKFLSEDFVLIPKRGLDLPLNEIFKYPFITLNRGVEMREGKPYKVINVIPDDKRADFSIATFLLDTVHKRIKESQITTKKDGSYSLNMSYPNPQNVLPSLIEVSFEMDKVKIPLRYMGKDADVDRKKLRSDEPKTGKIFLYISDYDISYQME